MECIFCKISRGELDAFVIYESDDVLCFLDSDPINEGHVLIVPRSHYLDLDEIPDDIAGEIMLVSKKILTAMKAVYDFPGYSIMQNGGAFNDIGHYHMHVFPRYGAGDFGWTFRDDMPDANNEDVALKLREALGSSD